MVTPTNLNASVGSLCRWFSLSTPGDTEGIDEQTGFGAVVMVHTLSLARHR